MKDEKYMRRALQLARGGEGRTAPNPMVGAVVVAGDRIIGEGFHRTFGGPHAEVNAIASVRPEDRHLLRESTIYVTLEPCSHYGKTPPCAKLIVDTGIPRVVVGAADPNPLVAGRGVNMLRQAGIEVREGVLAEECNEINRRFMTAFRKKRPWILLKWAQTADGFMAAFDAGGHPVPTAISTPLSKVWMHRQRAMCTAIMAGNNTLRIDKPSLNLRYWPGRDPKRVEVPHNADLPKLMEELYKDGIQSLMVEGGPTLLRSFIDAGLYDEIRIETSPILLGKGLASPVLPQGLTYTGTETIGPNTVTTFVSA